MYCSDYDSEPTITSKRKRARCGEYTGCVEMKDCTTCVNCLNMNMNKETASYTVIIEPKTVK